MFDDPAATVDLLLRASDPGTAGALGEVRPVTGAPRQRCLTRLVGLRVAARQGAGTPLEMPDTCRGAPRVDGGRPPPGYVPDRAVAISSNDGGGRRTTRRKQTAGATPPSPRQTPQRPLDGAHDGC